ncbi:MAG: hypothetical protein SGBAC_005735 [Bacillariaceae sp.]
MVFAAKSVVVCCIVLIGLREVFEAANAFAKVEQEAKSDKTEGSINHTSIHKVSNDHHSLRGNNQTNFLNVSTYVPLLRNTSNDERDDHEAKSLEGESSSSSSSEEEEGVGNKLDEKIVSQLNPVNIDENSELQNGEESVSDERFSEDGVGEEAHEEELNPVNAGKDSASQNQYSTWEKMWGSQITANSNEHDGISMEGKKRLWQLLANETFSANLNDLFAAFPRPEWQNSTAVYNQDAYDSLISKLVKSHQHGRNFTIVASGGSTTCGAAKDQPAIPQNERYYSKFAGYVNELLSVNSEENTRHTVQWIGQGHGARTSLHTSIFFDNFIPVNSDLLLWEFSINDAIDWFGDPDLFRQSLQSDLLVWLEEVNRMKQPAKVMLIYYWNTPYHRDELTNEIVGRAFEAHATIAREYDFVVGHINVGSFIDEVNFPGCSVWETCPLLNDKHHASRLGHVLTAYLLLNMMNPSKEYLLPSVSEDALVRESTYNWTCGVETNAKQILKNAITNPTQGWKSPLGAFTLDLPAIDQMTPRRMTAGSGLGEIELVDKADPIRQDRKRSTALDYCSNGDTSFSVIVGLEPMDSVQAVLLVFKKHETVLATKHINVLLNGSKATTSGRLVPMRVEKDPSILSNWLCHFSGGWSAFADTYWYIFEKPQEMVISMELCIPSNVRIPPKIQAIAFW